MFSDHNNYDDAVVEAVGKLTLVERILWDADFMDEKSAGYDLSIVREIVNDVATGLDAVRRQQQASAETGGAR